MHIQKRIIWPIALSAALALGACGPAPATPAGPTGAAPTANATAVLGTDPGATARDIPYDAAFIDSMIAQSERAVAMANQALQEAERPEVQALATSVISAQEAQIAQLEQWRAAWFPNLPETAGLGTDIGPLEIPAGPEPFDQRFIEAMLAHYEGTAQMAQDALAQTDRQELKDMAQTIVTTRQGEIDQLQQWLQEWYGGSS